MRSMAAAENLRVFALHRVLGHERLGRVYDALDRDAEAASHYVRFAELWEDADADVQARVRAARDRATTLSATVGDG
ncbi:MAG TPA: hypothetical protein VK849_15475 [Longimicrobiales bacterium]|nr:hypothetical protein [Longimicrobiales bacterium]